MTWGRTNLDAMPEEIGGALYNEEPETLGACCVRLVKSPEDLAQFIAGNANTAVAYLEVHLGEARFLYRDDIAIPLDADLTDTFAREIELARERATQPDVISAIVGLDPRNWKFVRVLLSEAEPDASAHGVAYQIAHLSRPLLDTLPQGAPR